MGYKEDALAFLGITKWHELGYKGKGIKIMSDEKISEKSLKAVEQALWGKVISPKGYSEERAGHGSTVMMNILMVCPEAECIAFPFFGNAPKEEGKEYSSEAADYIIQNKVNIFTTSCTSLSLSNHKRKAMQDCIENGCIFIALAGNDGEYEGESTIWNEPKAEEYLAIGGVKPRLISSNKWDWKELVKADYSSEGEELDYVTIAEILGRTGTSFCAPVFAGMCVLVQQFFLEKVGRTLYRHELIKFIDDNLIDLDKEGFDIRTGKGLFILPAPETIDVYKYIEGNIDYGGIPQVEEIMIKQILLTPSEYTRPQTKIKPTALAWHYVGNPNTTALANRNYFEGLKDSHETKASSHYIIGLGGEIIQCIPDEEKSFCTNEANNYTISIECCHPDNTGKFTDSTYKSMIWLGKFLMQKYDIKNNIRHYDVTGKCCPKWFVDNPEEWDKFKNELEGKTMEQEVSDWALDAWNWCKEKGYLDGTNPKGTVTREMLAQVLFNLFGKEK